MPTSPRHAYGEGMLAIVWEFVVKEECIPAFRRAYGPTGDWSALFRQHPGYEGTTLLQDSTLRARFVTIDLWENETLFKQMQRSSQREYARLDALFSEFSVSERELGIFHSL